MYTKTPSPSTRSEGAALLAHGFWAGAGFVGLSLLAGGVATYFDASALQTALSVVAGAPLAAIAWRRAGAALDRVDPTTAETTR